VTHYEKGKYDFALLHLDQQCVEDEIYKRGKGSLYRELNEEIQDIPKIVIMHGTPYYPEKFSDDVIVQKVKDLIGDNTMITNSFRASEQFGFGTPIWHGIDPDEWYDLPKEFKAVTFISPAGLDKYYDRMFLEAIREELQERDIFHCHISIDWSARDWEDYKTFLGKSLIYINPTKESPMPRSRTEAMISGSCVLTTPHQDADKFIVDGKNGFIIPRNPVAVADKVEYLLNHYDEAVRIGQEGRKTALDVFSMDKYQENWKKLLEKATGKKL